MGEDYGSDQRGIESCIARVLPEHETVTGHRDGDSGHEEIDRRNRKDQHAATNHIFFFHVAASRVPAELFGRLIGRVLNLDGRQ